MKLYLIPETSAEARAQNEHTLKAANAIKSQRIIDITNKSHRLFVRERQDAFNRLDGNIYGAKKANGKRGLEPSVHSTVVQLQKYDPKARLCDVDKEFLDGFVEYMTKVAKTKRTKKPFAKKTIKTYVGYIVSALNLAVDEGILSVNPGLAIDRNAIQGEQKKREYLTIDEVRLLIDTPCREDVKVPFLFSCFAACGLATCALCSGKCNRGNREGSS